MEVTQHKTRWLKVNNVISIWTSSKIYIFFSVLRILNGFQAVLRILMRCEISPFCFTLRGLMVTQKERHWMAPALPVSLGSRVPKTALIRPENSCIIHAPRKHPFKPAATLMTGMRLLGADRYQTYKTGTGAPAGHQKKQHSAGLLTGKKPLASISAADRVSPVERKSFSCVRVLSLMTSRMRSLQLPKEENEQKIMEGGACRRGKRPSVRMEC
ncbi:uncharacterized protein LOC125704395 [Brienomyrus brachyistius]|uniref:uncharacterized protein LOC125704395 n=1 Tax=Brienomyrus brachyistius TaxID=42636 RepID=UPI0020B361B8|nr:uncharacterized protein LOC125704395 [Brienomyrus brachyistius]